MDWAFILVVILSIFLAVFLILGIVLAIILIRITLQIKKVTDSAQKAAFNIESIVATVKKYSGPTLFSKSIFDQMKKFKKRKD